MRRIAQAAAAASLLGGAAATIETNLTMSDGTQLSTWVDLPLSNDTQFKAVLDRSPYGHYGIEMVALLYLFDNLAAVRQDVRGTGQSGGHFELWADSPGDTYETIDWIVQQPWSNGQVVASGASADGLNALSEAINPHPALQAQFIIFAGTRGYEMVFPGGALRYSLAHSWLTDTVRPEDFPGVWQQVLENEGPSSWWNRLNSSSWDLSKVTWPSVNWAGWYDIFQTGQLMGFEAYQTQSASAGKHSIVIDPCGHCQSAAKYFPRNTIEGRVLLPVLQSFQLFKGESPSSEGANAVTFYVMGANDTAAPGNYWTSLPAFPAFKPTPMYLGPAKQLSSSLPAANGYTGFTFDPANPVPTIGGNNLFLACGPLDQSPVQGRPDVLTFTSAPLADALAVTGPLIAQLWVSSSAVDTDFSVKLTDVYNDGTAKNLLVQDGIVRMRWRNYLQSAQPQLLTPGQVYPAEVSLWNTSYVFAPGHSIRVEISSSNFPRFAVNPNNGLPLTQSGANVTANNTIFFGPSYPSALVLPVVDLAALPQFNVLQASDSLVERYINGMQQRAFFEGISQEQAAGSAKLAQLKLRGAEAKQALAAGRAAGKAALKQQLLQQVEAFVDGVLSSSTGGAVPSWRQE